MYFGKERIIKIASTFVVVYPFVCLFFLFIATMYESRITTDMLINIAIIALGVTIFAAVAGAIGAWITSLSEPIGEIDRVGPQK